MKNKKVKLSSTQVGVIEALKGGNWIYRFVSKNDRAIDSYRPFVNGRPEIGLTMRTVDALIRLGIIYQLEENCGSHRYPEAHYQLTEFGKTYESPFKEE